MGEKAVIILLTTLWAGIGIWIVCINQPRTWHAALAWMVLWPLLLAVALLAEVFRS